MVFVLRNSNKNTITLFSLPTTDLWWVWFSYHLWGEHSLIWWGWMDAVAWCPLLCRLDWTRSWRRACGQSWSLSWSWCACGEMSGWCCACRSWAGPCRFRWSCWHMRLCRDRICWRRTPVWVGPRLCLCVWLFWAKWVIKQILNRNVNQVFCKYNYNCIIQSFIW